MTRSPWPALLTLLLAGCSSYPGADLPPAPPGEVLVRVEKALDAKNPDLAQGHLGRLDENNLQAEHLEKYLFFQAYTLYLQNDHWESFKKLRDLSSRFPVTRYASQTAWMEFQLGKSLLDARGGIFGIFSYSSYGLTALRHLTITWPDQTEPGRPENIIADDALAILADRKWQDGDWHGAISRYSQLATNYIRSEWTTLAYFRIAMGWYHLIEGVHYDQKSMHKAEIELQQFLDSKMGSAKQQQETRQALTKTREMLAQRCLQTARYYMTLNQTPGVLVHLKETISLYPQTEPATTARKLLPQWEKRAAELEQPALETEK